MYTWNPRTSTHNLCMFTMLYAQSVYMHTSLSYIYIYIYTCISIQPTSKPDEHLINSYKLLLLTLENKAEASNAYVISKNKGEKKRRKSSTCTSSQKVRTGWNWMGVETRSRNDQSLQWPCKSLKNLGGRDSSVVRALDSRLKGPGFKSL